jgi:hypothetical protein
VGGGIRTVVVSPVVPPAFSSRALRLANNSSSSACPLCRRLRLDCCAAFLPALAFGRRRVRGMYLFRSMFHTNSWLKNSESIPSSLSSTSCTPPNKIPRPLWKAIVAPARGGLGGLAGRLRRSHDTVGRVVDGASDPGGIMRRNHVSSCTLGLSTTREPPPPPPPFLPRAACCCLFAPTAVLTRE